MIDRLIGDYCLVRSDAQFADVCIVFSAAKVKAQSFMLSRVLEPAPFNQIFVNCVGNQWYIDGVPELGSSHQDLANALSDLVKDLLGPGGKVICVGSSMGAYPAVAIGAMIDADLVFATGGEYTLNLNGGLSKGFLKGREYELDVAALVNNSTGRYFVGCGSEAYTDLVCLADLCAGVDRKLDAFVLDGRGHSLPPFLQQKYGYVDLILDLLDGKGLPFSDEADDLHANPDLCRLLWQADVHKVENDDYRRRVLGALKERVDDPACRPWRSRILYAMSVLDLALSGTDHLAFAQQAAPDMIGNVYFQNHLARSLGADGQVDEAVLVGEKSMALQQQECADKDPMTPIMLGRLYKRQNDLMKAVNLLAAAAKAEPKKLYLDELRDALNQALEALDRQELAAL